MKKLLVSCLTLLFAGAMSLHAATAKETYDHDCAKCHGKDGKGQTFMGKRFHIKDYTNPKVQKEFKDEALVKAIKDGVKSKHMPAFGGKLNDTQIKDLVAYIRHFAKK